MRSMRRGNVRSTTPFRSMRRGSAERGRHGLERRHKGGYGARAGDVEGVGTGVGEGARGGGRGDRGGETTIVSL